MSKLWYWCLLNVQPILIGIGIAFLTGLGANEINAEVQAKSEFNIDNAQLAAEQANAALSERANRPTTAIAASTTIAFPDGTRCEGELPISNFTGTATCVYANGDRYTGEVKNAQANGQGIMLYANGDRYVGGLVNGKLQGMGTITYANGDRYEGEFQNGKFNGVGTYTFKNGDRMSGQWLNDKFDLVANGQSNVRTITDNNANPSAIFNATPQPVSGKDIKISIPAPQSSDRSDSSLPPSVPNSPLTDATTAVSSPPVTITPSTALSQAPPAPARPADSAEKPQTLQQPTPLQQPPIELFNLETANQLPAGGLSISAGIRVHSTDRVGFGSGLQIGRGAIAYGLTDNLQLGLGISLFDDTLGRLINGNFARLGFNAFAASAKYQLLKNADLIVAVGGSLELINVKSDGSLFTTAGTTSVAGSLQVPITYNLNQELQLHLTPGIAFFPDSISPGKDFYGTLFNLGTGLSWKPIERLNLFADINFPVAGRGNTVRSSDAAALKRIVYSAGARYLVNPAVSLDAYITNGFGMTPATRFLAFIPDGDQVAIGANLTYTPSTGQNYASTFRRSNLVTLSARDLQLLLDGFTLSSADTLLPGMFHVWGGTGAGTNFSVAYGLTNDVQLELLGQRFSEGNDPTAKNSGSNGSAFKFGAAAKVRFLDQVQGDPFSLSFKVGFSPAIAFDADSIGYFTTELPLLYRLTPQIALTFNPKAGFINNRSLVGAGLGVNYALLDALQLIGEFTPLIKGDSGQGNVWSIGFRYLYPELNLGVDVYGSNAIGMNSLGGLFAKTGGASVGFNIHWLFGGNPNR